MDKNPIEEAFELKDISSPAMQSAVKLWDELYKQPYADDGDCDYNPHMAVASTIVSKLTRTIFSEYQSNIESDNEKAEGLLKNLEKVKERAMQLAQVGGECLVKPVLNDKDKSFTFKVVPRQNYSILGSEDGVITDVGFYETSTIGNMYYTLAERRTVDSDGYLTLRHKLFESDTPGTLGDKITLSSISKYAMLPIEYTYPTPMHSIGLIQVKMPLLNSIDGSQDGISIYAPSAYTIKELNELEAWYKVEYKNARSKLVVSEDYARKDGSGRPIFDDDLLLPLDTDTQAIGNGIGVMIFNPTIRDESFQRRENGFLKMIENQNGLKRGMLSDVNYYQSDIKATEINLSNGEYSITIMDLQDVWAQVVIETFVVCGMLGQLYYKWGKELALPVLDFGDGVMYDRDRVFKEMFQQVTSGIMKPQVLIAWYHNIKWDPENEKSMELIETYMPISEDLEKPEKAGRGAL